MAGVSSGLTSEQVRAARMLLRWDQRDLAEKSGVSLPSIKRLEGRPGAIRLSGISRELAYHQPVAAQDQRPGQLVGPDVAPPP